MGNGKTKKVSLSYPLTSPKPKEVVKINSEYRDYLLTYALGPRKRVTLYSDKVVLETYEEGAEELTSMRVSWIMSHSWGKWLGDIEFRGGICNTSLVFTETVYSILSSLLFENNYSYLKLRIYEYHIKILNFILIS